MSSLIQNEGDYLATGFRDVDSAATAKMVQCLTFLDSLPSFQAYKVWVLEKIGPRPGDIFADLGCGLGFDVLRAASSLGPSGLSIGVDCSQALLTAARKRTSGHSNVDFVLADIHQLPFADGLLSSCKIDRTLQHANDPVANLREAFRIIRPGGTIACSEPDWATFSIDDTDRSCVQQIEEFWSSSFRNPSIGRQLASYLPGVGFADISVHTSSLIAKSFESSNRVFDLLQTAVRLFEATGSNRALEWARRAQDSDRANRITSSVTLFTYVAKKPLPEVEN